VSAKRCGTASVRVSLVRSLKRNPDGISTTKRLGNLAASVPQISGHGLWHRKPVTDFRPFRCSHDSVPRQTSPVATILGPTLWYVQSLVSERAIILASSPRQSWSHKLYRRTPSWETALPYSVTASVDWIFSGGELARRCVFRPRISDCSRGKEQRAFRRASPRHGGALQANRHLWFQADYGVFTREIC